MNAADRRRSDEEVARSILHYLEGHRDAADTAEGIARWWLLSERVAESADTVHRALERLVRTGELTVRTTPGGALLYSAAPHEGTS